MSLSACPDFEYIRRHVPIRDITNRLGLDVQGKMVRCWRPERHQHGDRTPSVGVHIRRNTARCFVCDSRSLSTIDLVMSVRGLDVKSAARWIAERYPVPSLPKGKHLESRSRWPERFRIGASDSRLSVLIRSGIWVLLSPAQRSILPVLDTFTQANETKVTISYRGIARYASIGSHSTISSAIRRFQSFHFLHKGHSATEGGFRNCNVYEWTLDNPVFMEIANSEHQKQQAEIEAERSLRAEAKARLRATLITSKSSVQRA